MSIEDLKSLMEPGRVVEDQDVIRAYIDDWTGRDKGSTSAVSPEDFFKVGVGAMSVSSFNVRIFSGLTKLLLRQARHF